MGKIWNATKKIVSVVGSPLFIFSSHFVATSGAYTLNQVYNEFYPSEIRREFKEKLGFKLGGWEADIDQSSITAIYDVMNEEKKITDFDLNGINIESFSYSKKRAMDKVAELVSTAHSGYYDLEKNTISLMRGFSRHTLTHEIKHAKTFEICRKNPEFLKEWEKLALDENGNSLYLTRTEQAMSRTKGLSQLVSEDKRDSKTNLKLGFISNYARTNVLEDIAVICSDAEENPFSFADLLFGNGDEKNEIIQKKVELAQKNKLLPQEFSEVVALEKEIKNITWPEGYVVRDSSKFMKESEKFIEKNPESIYLGGIIKDRARIFEEKAMGLIENEGRKKAFEKAVKEYKKVLVCRFKDRMNYPGALNSLAEIYTLEFKDKSKAETFRDAEREYYHRSESGNSELTTVGVNDFLKARGMLE